jgi:hypothetical protein
MANPVAHSDSRARRALWWLRTLGSKGGSMLCRDRRDSSQRPRITSQRLSASLLCTAFLISGCTTINVKKIDRASAPIRLLCIEENPRVAVTDLLSFLETSFQRHGIKTAVYRENSVPASCEYSLWYSAIRGWDLAPFLRFAEFRIRRGAETVATATYKHGGGFALDKWESTETKLTPLVEELLTDFPSEAKAR